MMHPLQYELENARHAHYRSRAAQQRLVAEAEHLATGRSPSVAMLRTMAAHISNALRMGALSRAESQ